MSDERDGQDAVPVAFKGEFMLAGWSETHNGGAKVTFWLTDPEQLSAFKEMTSAKGKQAGQRLAAVLVEIGDDEEPVDRRTVSQTAAALCKEPLFWAWLNTASGRGDGDPSVMDEAGAAEALRRMLGISSRSEIDKQHWARVGFLSIRDTFLRWERGILFGK